MPVKIPGARKPSPQSLQYSLLDLFLYFLAITLLISGYTTIYSGTVSENTSYYYIRYVLPVIVGGFLYLIGNSICRRMHYRRFPPITRFVLIFILLISSISVCYLLWADIRVSSGAILRPHDWPYPDVTLLKLSGRYELYYLNQESRFFIFSKYESLPFITEGETPRDEFAGIIVALEIIIGSFIAIVAWCLGLLLPFRLEWLDKLKSICKRCLMRR